MAITTKKPPIKETVGAQYICFDQSEDGEYSGEYSEEVECTEVVKSVTVTENAENTDVYASGIVYDTDSSVSSTDIEVEVIAFPAETLAKMRGDTVDEGGLILSGGKGIRPFFAYGKVVKLKKGKIRLEWYPKCRLAENTDETKTREESFSEQTDTITIKAYAFNDNEDIKAMVDSSSSAFPAGLTEEKFFRKTNTDKRGFDVSGFRFIKERGMKENFIDLTDGTRLSVRVNFGTIYYLQKQKGFYRIQKKAEKNKKKLTEEESFELAAYVIYAILRSNGKTVGFDEALSLVPPDTEQLEKVLQVFQEEYDRYVKKKQAQSSVMPGK